MPGKSHIHTHNDFELDKRAEWLDDLKRRCPCCSAEMAWKFPGCSACGTLELPLFICPDCDRSLESATLDYRAVGSTGNHYLTTIAGDQCPNCLKTFAYRSFVSELDDFVESVPHDLKVLPEIGIQTTFRIYPLYKILDRYRLRIAPTALIDKSKRSLALIERTANALPNVDQTGMLARGWNDIVDLATLFEPLY